jgi:cytochrome c553
MVWLAIIGVAAVGALVWITPKISAWRAAAEGAALYEGRKSLIARIAGHEEDLPPVATRCTNCHEGPQTVATLNAGTLAVKLPRRGGPPSRYDATALCRALREGIDPAYVTLPRAMPRYQIDDADCAAMWAHLSTRR